MLRRRRGRWIFAVALFGIALAARPATAQGTKADYDRAAQLGARFADRVFRASVRPRWDADGDGFWYRVATGPGRHEFVRVDATAGTRRPAVDHEAVATALAAELEREFKPEALPLEELAFGDDDGAVRFTVAGRRFAWRAGALAAIADEPPPGPPADDREAPRASRRTGEESAVRFENRTARPVALFWLDPEGRRRPYGTIAPGESRRQHTFEGHVWEAVGADGRVLRRVEAGADPVTTVVDGRDARPDGPRPPREGDGDGDRPRRRRGGGATSPDGRLVARIEGHNVQVRDNERGESFALTTDGTADDPYTDRFFWSPDSARLVVLRIKPAQEHPVTLVESSPRDQLQPRVKVIDYLKPGDRIAHPRPRLFDVPGRKAVPVAEDLFPNPWSLDEFRWEDDSSRFTFLYNERGHQVLRLVAVDARTGEVATLIDETSRTFVDYAHKTFLHRLASGDLVWMSERSGWNGLYRVDGATGQVRNAITGEGYVVRRVERVDEEEAEVLFWAGGVVPGEDPYYQHLCRAKLDGSGFTVLTGGDGTHTVAFSPDGRYFVDTYSRVDLPPVTALRRSGDGSLVLELERGDASALAAAGWRAPERFAAKGRDGTTDIYGVIFTPTTFDPATRYPVIEQIYAGPQGAFVPKGWGLHAGQQELAELGFVVVQVDGMGTNWRSKAFHDACWKNLGDAGFPDRIAWMTAAARTRPWMDLGRVGIVGGSAGGQNALRGLLAHGDFYKAGAADCGCHDNRMDKIWWNELWMGWPVDASYERSANAPLARNLVGKLLLVVGELDTNVDPASTMQVVDALVKADKDFDLLVVPGAGHGAAGSPYGRRRVRDFFVRSLMGVEPRREAKVVGD
jgi:dipeptidyl aminopeptidase/acylaminoacyl peptidase